MKKKILLTGSTGYIGKNIIEKLDSKYHLLPSTHRDLDLLDLKKVTQYLRKNPVDIIIHAAYIGGSRREKDLKEVTHKNLRMFFNLVNNKKYYHKLIFFGSGAEYDKNKPIKMASENDYCNRIPDDEYGFSKYVCSKYAEKTNFIINLKLFGLFGKYEDYRVRFISNAICKSMFNLPITMKQNVYFDYLYIDDLINILDYFINHKSKFNSYNIGTGKPVNLLTIAQKILTISGKKLEIIIKKKGLANEYTCNNSRLKSEIKGLKFGNFDDSLKSLYRWYLFRKSSFNKNDFLKDI